jgi:hypothetical protein
MEPFWKTRIFEPSFFDNQPKGVQAVYLPKMGRLTILLPTLIIG